MDESVDPRTGENPVTCDPLAPPGAALLENAINGHEYSVSSRDNLQHACIFPLAQPRDCSSPGPTACDCSDPSNDSPLCQDQNGNFTTTQYYAKAYPSLRELTLLKEMGSQGAVGSICPAQLNDPNARDYGYNPSFAALAEVAAKSLPAQ